MAEPGVVEDFQRLRTLRRGRGVHLIRWHTAGDACGACAALNDRVYPSSLVMPPLHPNCKCSAENVGTVPSWLWSAWLLSGGFGRGEVPMHIWIHAE